MQPGTYGPEPSHAGAHAYHAYRYKDAVPKGEVQLVACVLIAARGLVLADTEREADGEEGMKKALTLDRQPQRFAALLQQVYLPAGTNRSAAWCTQCIAAVRSSLLSTLVLDRQSQHFAALLQQVS